MCSWSLALIGLPRSIGDLQDIVRTAKARGASLKATEQPINTGTAAGKCFLDILTQSPSRPVAFRGDRFDPGDPELSARCRAVSFVEGRTEGGRSKHVDHGALYRPITR
jgi:hypothetical protein